jgi:hypothetical protein
VSHMARLHAYRSGMVACDYSDRRYPRAPYRGKQLEIDLQRPPPRPGHVVGGREVVIHAASHATAQRVSDLILASLSLVGGMPPIKESSYEVHPIGKAPGEPRRLTFERHPDEFFSTHDIPLACLVAAKASFRRAHVYALAKYHLAIRLHSNWPVDVDPAHSEHTRLSPLPEHHVRFACAIMVSYSVLEELGLEIRASANKPSFISGRWNPPVKEDLEQRLDRAGVDLGEPIYWNVRGTPTVVERKSHKKIQLRSRAPWAYRTVRDCAIPLVDAIAVTDWIRDRVTAHKLRKHVASLSVYDIDNAHHLARRMLLESLGFWRWGEFA